MSVEELMRIKKQEKPPVEIDHVKQKTIRWISGICLTVTLFAGIASFLGYFYSGSESTILVISPRGEQFFMTTSGVYRFNAQRLVIEGMGWDVFTLFVAVPAMLINLPQVVKGSMRGRLFALGLLVHFFYQFFLFALSWSIGPLFLFYILIFVGSLSGIVLILSSINFRQLTQQVSSRFPYGGMTVLCFGVAVVLLVMWLWRITAINRGEYNIAKLFGQTTLVIQAFDLGLFVPFAVTTGFMTWKRRPISIVLSSVMALKSIALITTVYAMFIAAFESGNWFNFIPFTIFLFLTFFAVALAVSLFHSISEGN